MGVYLAEQTLFFLQACLLGAGLGLVYDLFRITRIALPTARGVVFAEDVVFFLVCAAATFLFMLRTIDGQVRVFILLGEGIGAVLYFMALSPLVMGISGWLIRVVKGIIGFLLRIFVLPVLRLLRWTLLTLLRPLRFLGNKLKKSGQRAKYRLKVRRVILYNHCKSVFPQNLKRKRKSSAHEPPEDQA